MHHVASNSMGILGTALVKLMPSVTGPGSEKVQTLLGVIRGHDEALLQTIEQQGYQERHACLLGLLHTWKVRVDDCWSLPYFCGCWKTAV